MTPYGEPSDNQVSNYSVRPTIFLCFTEWFLSLLLLAFVVVYKAEQLVDIHFLEKEEKT